MLCVDEFTEVVGVGRASGPIVVPHVIQVAVPALINYYRVRFALFLEFLVLEIVLLDQGPLALRDLVIEIDL